MVWVKGEIVSRVREFLRKSAVADIGSISRLTEDRRYAWVLMNYLVRRGEVNKLTRGYYTIHEDPSLFVYCMKPAYLGLQDAMSFHNLWEQETVPIVITCRRVRTGVRKVLGHNVIVRRISPKYFFGYEFYQSGDFLLPVSNVEKTFLDMIYFGEIRRDIARLFKPKLSLQKIRVYLAKYPPRFRQKALDLLG